MSIAESSDFCCLYIKKIGRKFPRWFIVYNDISHLNLFMDYDFFQTSGLIRNAQRSLMIPSTSNRLAAPRPRVTSPCMGDMTKLRKCLMHNLEQFAVVPNAGMRAYELNWPPSSSYVLEKMQRWIGPLCDFAKSVRKHARALLSLVTRRVDRSVCELLTWQRILSNCNSNRKTNSRLLSPAAMSLFKHDIISLWIQGFWYGLYIDMLCISLIRFAQRLSSEFLL